MSFAPGLVVGCDSIPNRLSGVCLCVMLHRSCASRPGSHRHRQDGCRRRWPRGWRVGKFMRRRWSCTRRLQGLGQLHQKLDAFGRARHASGDDHRIFGVHQQLRGFRDGGGVALRRRAHDELGNAQVLLRDRLFLQARRRPRSHRLVAAASSRSCKRARRIRRSASSVTGVSSHLV